MTPTAKEAMAYTALAYSYYVGFYNMLKFKAMLIIDTSYSCPYKGYRTYLTNHMGSLSCH